MRNVAPLCPSSKILLVVAVLLVTPTLAHPKLAVHINVSTTSDKVTTQLREGMEARINGTDRYEISVNAIETDLILAVNCIVLDNGALAACDSDVTYFPYRYWPLSIELERAESIVTSGTGQLSYIVDTLMNHFINGSTDAVLSERKKFLRESIQAFCADEPSECKKPASRP